MHVHLLQRKIAGMRPAPRLPILGLKHVHQLAADGGVRLVLPQQSQVLKSC